MKILKRILIVLVILIAIPLVIAGFTKKEYSVQREVTINKPKSEVFNYIRLLKNQDNYNKWVMMDPELKKAYKGTDGQVGFIYAWEGEKGGKGEQEIKSIIEGERVDSDLRFIEPFEGKAKSFLSTESISEGETRVKWRFDSSMPYPMNVMLVFMDMDKMLGADMETGLENLKKVLEKKD